MANRSDSADTMELAAHGAHVAVSEEGLLGGEGCLIRSQTGKRGTASSAKRLVRPQGGGISDSMTSCTSMISRLRVP